MILRQFWATWLPRHKVGVTLFGAALAATLLVANINRRGESKSLVAASRSDREAADTSLRANRLEEAERSCRQALSALEKLVAGRPGERSFRRDRAQVVDTLGLIQTARDQLDAAEATWQQGIVLWALLVAEDPTSIDDRLRMAACINRLGSILREAGRWEEAEEVYQRGRRLCEILPIVVANDPRIRQQLAIALEQLGLLRLDMGRRSEAIEYYAGAIKAQKAAIESSPGEGAELALLVSLLVDQSRVLASFRRKAEAEGALVEAVALAERLRTSSPAEASYQDLTATALTDLAGEIQAGPERVSRCLEYLNRALTIREKLAAQSPMAPDSLAKLAAAQVRLADLYRDRNSTAEPETLYRKAISGYARLSHEHPRDMAYRLGHGQTLRKLAELLRERGRAREGLPIARESIRRLSDVYNENLRDPDYRLAIGHAYRTLCALELESKDYRALALAIREYLRIEPNGFEEALESARFLSRCIPLGRADQSASPAERDAMTGTLTDLAMVSLQTAVRNGFRDLDDLIATPTYGPLRGRDDFRRLVRDVEARNAED